MSVSATDVAVLPTDVSVPSNIPSNDSALPVLLKEDASLPDAFAEAHDAAHRHSHTVPIVYNEEKPEHESKVASTPPLESGSTTSDSLAAENDLNAAVIHVSVPMKETDKTTTNGLDVDATTAEHPEPLTSESVMAIADTADESGADKSIGHDSGIEILGPPLEKMEDEGKDHVPADKPDIEAAAVVESDAAAGVEDTPEDTHHTRIDESSVEEVAQVEATEATLATEDNTTPAVEQGNVTEDQPQVDVTSEEPAAETNGSEGEKMTVRGVEVEQETVHEAEPAAAVINNVEDNTHEATLDQHQHAQAAPQTTLEANGHEATLQESEEPEPEVTLHVQEASIVESPADHVVDVAAETVEASTNHGVAAAVASEEIPTPVEAPNGVVPAPSEVTETASEEAPVAVEVEAVGEERIEAPAAVDKVVGVVAEQIQAPVDAAVAESAAEEVPTHAEIEIVAEAASEGVSAPVKAQSVASDGVAKPAEVEHAVEVPVEAKPATEVPGETSAVVEAEVATSEEVAEGVPNEIVPAHVEGKPAAEAIETTTSTRTPVAEVLNEETLAAVVNEETSPLVETEPAAEAIPTTSDEVADDAHVGAKPVAEEPARSKPVGEEAKATAEATDEDIPAPVGAEPTISAASEAPTTVHEEKTLIAVDLAENAPLMVSDPEPKVSVQAVLKDRETPESQAGIRDDTEAEVVSKPASVALATWAVEETPSAVPEPAKETSAEEQPDSAPAENVYLSAATTSEVVKDNDIGEVEPLTELTTEPLSIQTSVDTTPFTPIVDSGIEFKEQEIESQPPNLLSIAEEIERPKSPWSPSFQVTTVGQGNLLEDAEVGLVQDNPTKIVDTPILIVEDAAGASENLTLTDEQSLEPPARPWTPSYSVHLQGSPVQGIKELTEDVPLLDKQHVDEVMPEQVHGSTIEDNDAISEQVVTRQETGEVSVSDSEVEDVALTDTTEPSTEDADMPVIAVADEGVKEVAESSLQSQHLTSDAPESSAKLWMPSYSVHAQGSLLQPPKELESGIGNIVLVESIKATVESKAVEGLGNAEADSLTSEQSTGACVTDVASVTPTVDIGNEKLVGEANTTTGQETADNTTLEVSGTPWAPSYSVHAQSTHVVKSAELEVPMSVVDAEPFGVATSNGSASLEPPTEHESISCSETKDVEETTAELPVLSVSTESSENTAPEAPEESWTPSYSVHSQGSPLIPRTEFDGAAHSQGTPVVAPKELEDIVVHDVEFEGPVETEAQQLTPVSSLLQTDSVAVESHSQNNDTAVPTTDAQDKHTNEDNEAEAILPAIVLVAPLISLAPLDTAAENPVAVSEVEGSTGPWTSSYSVHSQGSPSLDPVMLEDEQPSDNHNHTDETEVYNAQRQVSESSVAAEVASELNGTSEEVQSDDQAVPAWVPSYSISVQGTGVEKTEIEASSGSTIHSDVEHSAPVEIDAMTSVDKSIPALLVSGAVSSNNAVPELPWTPSYLVTQQGSGLPVEDGGKLDKLEFSSQPISEASSVPDDTEPQLNEVQQQSNESNAVQLRPGQVVGSADEKFMLFGLRAIVAYLWVLPRWLSMTRSPSESGHSREASSSSSSSKFFPGGWFSTKPNEGRTSLDTAQGEFAASPKTTSDVFETISAETMYREAGVSTSATTVEDGTNGQNRRWCIVM